VEESQLRYCRANNISLTIGFTRLFVHVVIALFTGLMFFQLGNRAIDLQSRIFCTFQAAVIPALVMAQVEPRYDISRMIFIRENSSKMYSQIAFIVSIVIAEIPYGIMAAVAYFVCFYFPAGFNIAPERAGYQFLIILIDEVSHVAQDYSDGSFSQSRSDKWQPPSHRAYSSQVSLIPQ
jgi:ATP-binding cassette, subfamily G (WHITE), member 2, SNQ2